MTAPKRSRIGALQTAGRLAICAAFPGSSVVEQAAVNRWVAGSNPARGASKTKGLRSQDCHCSALGYPRGTIPCELGMSLATISRRGLLPSGPPTTPVSFPRASSDSVSRDERCWTFALPEVELVIETEARNVEIAVTPIIAGNKERTWRRLFRNESGRAAEVHP